VSRRAAIHEAAAVGFDAGAEAYERGRPGYPQDAGDVLVRALGIERGGVLFELAAGAGLAQLDRSAAERCTSVGTSRSSAN
jgi:hypothetical protein